MIAALWVAAAATPSPTPNPGPAGEAAKAGPIWAVVVGALVVACFFLFRSMIKQLRKVRENPGFRIPGPDDVDRPPVLADPAPVSPRPAARAVAKDRRRA